MNDTDTATHPLQSALLAISRCLIGRKHGLVKEALAPRPMTSNAAGSWAEDGHTIASTGPGLATFDVPCAEGDEVHQVEIIATGNGAADATCELVLLSDCASPASLARVIDANRPGGAYGVVALTPATPFIVPARARVVLEVNASAAGYAIGTVVKVFARP